jgi:hypothetical protein
LSLPPYTDADFLYSAIEAWLVGRFMDNGGTAGSGFVESLVQVYGEVAVSRLLMALQADSSIAVLESAYSIPLDQLAADWREFFQWRLALEPFLLGQGLGDRFLALYDDLAQQEAQRALADPNAASQPPLTVLNVVTGPGSDGLPRAWAVVQYPDGSQGPITFRLVNGVWLRSAIDPAYDALAS